MGKALSGELFCTGTGLVYLTSNLQKLNIEISLSAFLTAYNFCWVSGLALLCELLDIMTFQTYHKRVKAGQQLVLSNYGLS